jgi:diguanylate cyclase (GGDEF)-like protein/PAS domain S-box-containing protein
MNLKDPRAHPKSDVDLPLPKVLRVLCAEDVPADAELYLRVLQDAGYQITADVVSTREDFARKLESGSYDVVLSDHRMLGWSGTDALEVLKQSAKDIPFLLVTGTIGEEAAAECIKQGAADYILKDRPTRLPDAVRRALEEKALREERARAEEALKLFRLLVDQSNDMIQVVDLETMRLLDVNARACLNVDYTREELLSMSVRDIDPTVDETVRARVDGELLKSGYAMFQGLQRRKDGSTFPVEVGLRYVHLDRKYIVCTIRDISERKQAEKRMAGALHFMQTILDTSPLGIVVYKASGEAVVASPASAQLVGTGIEQVRAQNFRHLESWRQSGLLTLADEALATSALCHREVHIATTFGKELWVNAYFAPFDFGDEPHLWTMFEDITGRKKTEAALQQSETKFKTLFETAHDGIMIINGGIFSDCNVRAEALFQCGKDDIVGHSPVELSPPRQPDGRLSSEKAAEKIQAALNGLPQIFEWLHLRHDGTPFDAEVSLNRSLMPEAVYLQAVIRDITERKLAEEALLFKTALLEAQSETTIDGILVVDESGHIVLVNKRFGLHFGVPDEVLSSEDDLVVGKYVTDQVEAPDAFIEKVKYLYSHRDEKSRDEFKLKSGKTFDRYSAPLVDSKGWHRGRIWYFRDITDRKVAEERVQYLAYYDALTGLPNRTLLLDRLAHALAGARRRKDKVALLFLDLDRFKDINDAFGHSLGDLLLQEVAKRLERCVREQDTVARLNVARLNGDEFLIVLTGVNDISDAAVAAKRFMETMTVEFAVQGHSLSMTCCLGISIFPEHGADGETLIKNADAAMYCAKDRGRNNFQFFTEDMNAQIVERLTLESSLRLALERKEFFLVYQPQMDIGTGKITGLEALLRWQHPDLGLVPPDKFIPIAEKSDLILPIGEWVLRTACAQARKWHDEGLGAVPVAVNVSAVQFRQENFSKLIGSVLLETGIASQCLELELTESLLLSDAVVTLSVLQDLKAMGLKLAIDDFGTGYSSLSYLKRFPINKLKIDRSFIRDVAVNPDDSAITTAIIAMAKQLKLKVIAEAVEDEAQLLFLRENHCDEIQGYYFCKPLAVDAVADFLRGAGV